MKRFIILHGAETNVPYYIQVSQICGFGTAEDSNAKATIVKFPGNDFFCAENAEQIMALIEED
jgi:hypothetical protein